MVFSSHITRQPTNKGRIIPQNALASISSHISPLWGQIFRKILLSALFPHLPTTPPNPRGWLLLSHWRFPCCQIQVCSQSLFSLHRPVAPDTGDDQLMDKPCFVSRKIRLALLFSSSSGQAVFADFYRIFPSLPQSSIL